jgi:hypothetical protein
LFSLTIFQSRAYSGSDGSTTLDSALPELRARLLAVSLFSYTLRVHEKLYRQPMVGSGIACSACRPCCGGPLVAAQK